MPIIDLLLASDEPSIRFKVRTRLLGEDPDAPGIQALREEIRTSPRVVRLLSERRDNGTIPGGVYRKWTGAHWVLAALAYLGYPAGDAALAPLVDQVCAAWLSERHVASVRIINGRARRCASQESNALYAMLALGFQDARADRLAENLLRWQWPDGGWNCDNTPAATTSSFHESWIPLRALALYARLRDHAGAREAVARAAEIFLSRRLYRRLRDGNVMKPSFLQLMYPPYWHYTILNGLTVMVEAGYIGDPRCAEALDVLESKRLPDGGFPAEYVCYTTEQSGSKGNSRVGWGGKHAARMNPWVTAEALSVLKAAGRL
ncbi:MAG: hypothetical protein BWY76_00251 [bacterium ADurb.Bin429]|nr:MAG: hypothetical protein BWY76_00251 [bacterium ADurb.Bin429]